MLTPTTSEVTRAGRPFVVMQSDIPPNMTIVDYRRARQVATAIASSRENRILACVTSWALFLLSMTKKRRSR